MTSVTLKGYFVAQHYCYVTDFVCEFYVDKKSHRLRGLTQKYNSIL